MGVLPQQTKMLKKLAQLDLFESEPNERTFAQFVHEELERILPKPIPINSLGLFIYSGLSREEILVWMM